MNKEIPVHAPIEGFGVLDHVLTIGGIPVTQLADRVGSTPYFAYDRALLTERVKALRAALPPEVKIHYAMKANPMPAVVQHMAGLVDGIDVASAGEMKVALDTTMPAHDISFAGPGKTRDELARAVAAGIIINLESFTEMETIADICRVQGHKAKVAVRVNPDFELKTSGMRMSGGSKPFGVDAEKVPDMLARMKELALDFWGFHIFSGSQNLREESISEAQEKAINLAIELSRGAPRPPRIVNIGGGFGIPYFPGDKRLSINGIGARLGELMPKVKSELPGAEIVIELGRYLVGEAGVYITRVVDRKDSRGQIFLVTDGGLHHQLSASGNFGQVIRKNYPVAIANRMDMPAEEKADIVGCLCTPLDRLGDHVMLPKGKIGDLIAVFQSGAYGLTSSPTAFLGHPAPAEILV